MQRLAEAAAALPGATVIVRAADYLYVEFASRVMGFVDDLEVGARSRRGRDPGALGVAAGPQRLRRQSRARRGAAGGDGRQGEGGAVNPLESWQEEQRSAYLYRACAKAEHGTARGQLFQRLAGEAEAQAAIWRAQLTSKGKPPPRPYAPDARARLVARLVGMVGPQPLRRVLAAMKVRGMSVYDADLRARRGPWPAPLRRAARAPPPRPRRRRQPARRRLRRQRRTGLQRER